MTIVELKDDIMKNNIKHVYIFTGSELGIMQIYLEQMSKKLGMPIVRENTMADVYSKCQGGSLFGSSEGFYVVRGDTDYMKHEEAYSELDDVIKKSYVVMLFDKIDSRLKFGKFFKSKTVDFEKLAPNVLSKYIAARVKLSNDNIETLIQLCDGSYDLCMLEVDKILQFSSSSPNTSFKNLLNTGVIYQPEFSDVFKFTEAVLSKNRELAFKSARILQDNGISAINALGTLYNSLKTVMLIQSCPSNVKVCDATGLDNRQVYFNKKYVGNFDLYDLVEYVKMVSEVISMIKSGEIDEKYAMYYVLVNIFS